MHDMSKVITTSSDWSPELMEKFYNEIERIAKDYLKLDTYPNQIEIISSEQMLDAYSSVAMPVMYPHWSFGKQFASQAHAYKRGHMGLAYEVVINSNPCIAYCMEENTMAMQALVMAHACFGHNAFFKNNYLFKQWTDAEAIIDYLVFARDYIQECEEKYGAQEVERVLDACHALMNYGVDRYKRPSKISLAEERDRQRQREEYQQSQANDLWRTIPNFGSKDAIGAPVRFGERDSVMKALEEPQENLLYFIEKRAPNLEPWHREIIRIVRKIAQYFYPQRQTQLMNEGFATFTHYNILQRMYDEGLVEEGFMLQFLESHTAVVAQRGFDSKYFSGINPYALGFAMFQDIKRICMEPTEEDRDWFGKQDWVGNGDWISTTKWAMENFKDESFVRQFLSPKVIRDFKLFTLLDDQDEDEYVVTSIHDTNGYKAIRESLANQYMLALNEPNIQITHVHFKGDRSIYLTHRMQNGRLLNESDTINVLKYMYALWQFDVVLDSVSDDINHQVSSVATYSIREGAPTIEYFMDDR
jgi:stage V sporulation protein R